MSWFEEQIKERKQQDEKLFSESIEGIANSVTGRKNLHDKTEISKDAIETILKYYGFKPKDEPQREVTDFGDQMNMLCRPFGLMYREIKLKATWWKDCIGPVLAFFSDDRGAVAVLPDGIGYYYLKNGKKEYINRKNQTDLTEKAYCFYKPFPNRKLIPLDLIKYALLTRSVKDVVLILLFMGIATMIGLLTPKLSNFLYSTVVESRALSLLISTIFFMLCASVSSTLFTQFKTLYNEIIATKMNIAVQAATMMRVLSLPPRFFRQYSSGELSERSEYITNLTQTLVSMLFGTGLSALFSLVYIKSILEFASGLAVLSIIIILVTVLFSLISAYAQQRISKEKMELETKESGISYAMISGIKKIKVSGAEKRAFARWADIFAKKTAKTYNPPSIVKLNSVIMLTISTIGTLVMYYFAIKTGVDMAEYNAFTVAYGMVYGAFSTLGTLVTSVSEIKPIFDMAKPIMDCIPETSENKKIVTSLAGQIEFNNVSFAYPENSELIVDNMTLTIKPNQYIGIVGKTGCGKSTLIRLLLGFEKPQKGTIYYDGKDINSLDLKSLRRKIGVVMQDGKLFQGDIFSNITLSAPWLTLDEAWDAAEIAGIADDIADMPMGMHTIISEGSGGVSGGQKQRLIIARAIAPKPKILIFDEATSALDNITQKKVSDALDNLRCTRIVVAHRLSTIKHCDRILYLGNGRILEDGTYEELIAKKGLFAELIERQRIDT